MVILRCAECRSRPVPDADFAEHRRTVSGEVR